MKIIVLERGFANILGCNPVKVLNKPFGLYVHDTTEYFLFQLLTNKKNCNIIILTFRNRNLSILAQSTKPKAKNIELCFGN